VIRAQLAYPSKAKRTPEFFARRTGEMTRPTALYIVSDLMRNARTDTTVPKGWWFGAWNSSLPIAVGFATTGINEPHLHRTVTEIYLVARGTSRLQVGDATIELSPGDMVVVEPGEAHTFLGSSSDYLHFVVHTPSLSAEEMGADRLAVPRDRLGA